MPSRSGYSSPPGWATRRRCSGWPGSWRAWPLAPSGRRPLILRVRHSVKRSSAWPHRVPLVRDGARPASLSVPCHPLDELMLGDVLPDPRLGPVGDAEVEVRIRVGAPVLLLAGAVALHGDALAAVRRKGA